MTASTEEILEVLNSYGIYPGEEPADIPDFPEIGEISEHEIVYPTSLDDVLGELGPDDELSGTDDPRMREWLGELEAIIRSGKIRRITLSPKAPEPACAWYCPIHYFGHAWGIYIKEDCLLAISQDLATYVDWTAVRLPFLESAKQLLRAAFYVFFLHEQFHHKVESFGLRALIATGSDRYRPYKSNVYRRFFGTSDCLEESLANAQSFNRLAETRYKSRLDSAINHGLKEFLWVWMSLQAPGYREGLDYISRGAFRKGLHQLQSEILDGSRPAATPENHWSVAQNMSKALGNISKEIYVIMPSSGKAIFPAKNFDPSSTTSSKELEKALIRHYGYNLVQGGKGSHVKLKKTGSATIILPGQRETLSKGAIKSALKAIGGYPLSRLPDVLVGAV